MFGAYTFRYSLLRKWTLDLWQHPLQLNAGGTVAANAGFIYTRATATTQPMRASRCI